MADSRFFSNSGARTLEDIAAVTGAQLLSPDHGTREVADVAPLDRAEAGEISFLDNAKYMRSFTESKAGACFIREKYISQAPKTMALLITEDPYRCYALAAQQFYPFVPVVAEIDPRAVIDPSARIGEGCSIGPGAFIGKKVVLGKQCVIGPNAVLHDGVEIGDDTRIGALSSVSHAIIGERCIIHRGVHIGQDGFGFALNRDGHIKVPQLGRVMIGSDVEIGAGTCIDRGTGPDTSVGDGTKIDNLVQIGHNVQIGRGAVIVAQTGIAGSTRIGDGAVLGGQCGVAGHLTIGAGAKLAAQAGVMTDIPVGAAFGGSPAVPAKDWHRQNIALRNMAGRSRVKDD